MSRRSAPRGRAWAVVIALLAVAGGCYGSGQGNETVRPVGENPMPGVGWRLVPVEGTLAVGIEEIVPRLVEASNDGTELTVFFEGGDPSCHAVTGVRIERRDPGVPAAAVSYGTRLGVLGCNAALYPLAVRVPLEPPLGL